MICLENTFYQSDHSNIASAVSGDRQVSKMRAIQETKAVQATQELEESLT